MKSYWTIAAGLLILASSANAGLIILAPGITGAQGSSGTFDILLDNTGPGSVSISAFSFGITTLDPGITFTDATIGTVTPYIFGSDTLFGPDITITSGVSLTASDSPLSVPSYTVASGATVGLGHVSYSIAGGAGLGLFAITLDPLATSLADAGGNNISGITLTNGSLDVVVPEPSTLLFGGLALGAMLTARRLLQ
jgi:hypothetical protein